MTSVIRSYAVRKEGTTKFLKPDGPSYFNGTIEVIFPFTYSNGVLDISYSGNNFKALMVDTPDQSPNSENVTAVSIMGGPYLATSLGNNFKNYIRSWRSSTIDSGSPIEIYTAPQLLRVQEADFNHINSFNPGPYTVSTEPPSSDDYITGSVSNNYQTAYVFKTPLTFTIIESSIKQYITFRSIFDQE